MSCFKLFVEKTFPNKIQELLFASQCPDCGVKINNYDHYDYLTCTECKFKFCSDCSIQVKDDLHEENYC